MVELEADNKLVQSLGESSKVRKRIQFEKEKDGSNHMTETDVRRSSFRDKTIVDGAQGRKSDDHEKVASGKYKDKIGQKKMKVGETDPSTSEMQVEDAVSGEYRSHRGQ